jgi:hypothetical protein
MDIGEVCLKEGHPEEITPRVQAIKMKEAEKLKQRSQILFDYISQELVPAHAKLFSDYYLQLKHK